jgi:translation initiation factor IF-2
MAEIMRPPVITIMGHVDHGKTSLLDRIRQTHVAAGEAGGITQHIGAYQAEYQGKILTFIDTPGHAAFSEMRSRGAKVTDIVVLVVAADDGVKPQTIESIQHIQAAKVPYVVAINKSDVVGAQPEKVKSQLTEYGVYVHGYGGDVECVAVSAKTGAGVDDLLFTLTTMGDMLELRSDPDGELSGVIIESSKEPHLGCVATILVKNGSLRPRSTIYIGSQATSIRLLQNYLGKTVSIAGPSMPVLVTGFTEVPPVGMIVTSQPVASAPVALTPHAAFTTGPALNIIVKSDYAGTLEALKGSLTNPNINLIATGLGDVLESDIHLAETTKATIITFQTKANAAMKKLAQYLGVKIREYSIIYDMLEDMDKRVYLLLNPDQAERETGRATVLQTFQIRGQFILGCKVLSGTVRRNDLVHHLRGEEKLRDAVISSLKDNKTDVDSASADQMCGIVLNPALEVKVGDQIMAYTKIEA